jgi:predicted cobalt transporter CbtA
MAMQTHDTDSNQEATKNPDPAPGTDSDTSADAEDTGAHRPRTFHERHALKVLGIIMAVMFALVIAVQVGC